MAGKVLVSVDLGAKPAQARVLKAGARLAALDDAELNVMAVTPDFGMSTVSTYFREGAADEMVEDMRKDLHAFVRETLGSDANIQHIVAAGAVDRKIIEMAEQIGADLIVMGAHHPGAQDYIIEPNAASVAAHSNCSVFIVRDLPS